MQALSHRQARQHRGGSGFFAARAELASWPELKGAVVPRDVAQQFAGTESLEADRADALLACQRQDFLSVAAIAKRPYGEHRHVTEVAFEGFSQHPGVMARNAPEAELSRFHLPPKLLHAATRRGQLPPLVEFRNGMENEQVHHVQ